MSESVENTLVGQMCYQFANEVECMSQVRVNPETGEFDASQAFSDMLDFTEGDTAQPESEFLFIGANRLAVARLEDPSAKADGNHVNAMLLRVADLAAFHAAVVKSNQGQVQPTRPRP